MSGGAAFAGRADAGAAQQAAEGLAAEREAFDLTELLAKMVVIETGIGGASQLQDAVAQALGQAAVAGPSATGVCQSRCAALPIAGLEALHMPRRQSEQLRGSGTRQLPLHALRNHFHSLQFLLTQRVCLHRGDIFTLPLRGDIIMELRQAARSGLTKRLATPILGVCLQ